MLCFCRRTRLPLRMYVFLYVLPKLWDTETNLRLDYYSSENLFPACAKYFSKILNIFAPNFPLMTDNFRTLNFLGVSTSYSLKCSLLKR